jgi:hypothetical protein
MSETKRRCLSGVVGVDRFLTGSRVDASRHSEPDIAGLMTVYRKTPGNLRKHRPESLEFDNEYFPNLAYILSTSYVHIDGRNFMSSRQELKS